MTERLRLKAIDQDDLQIMAACLQDALVPLQEMAFLVDDHRFMAAFNRFQWEHLSASPDAEGLMVCQSALRIDHVDKVKYRGIDREIDGINFELLTITATATEDDAGLDIALLFAGDAAIKLHVSELCLTLEDFGDPWKANVAPQHDLPDDKGA